MEGEYTYFILDKKKKKVIEGSRYEAEQQLLNILERRVAYVEVRGYRVSTVFLPIPYRDLFFETMIFEPNSFQDIYCVRCRTYEEAIKAHDKAANFIRNLLGA